MANTWYSSSLSITMSTNPNHEYRAALALNNMAATLIQRGCYGVAMTTLCDSLTMMQLAFVPDSKPRCGKSQHNIFQAASSRYALALKVRSIFLGHLEADPIDDDDVDRLRGAVRYGPSSTIAFPIKIGAPSCDESEPHEITKQFGIILYNHGLAAFLLSLESPKEKTSRHLKRSLKSLKMAKTSYDSLENGEDLSGILLTALTLNVMSLIFQSQDLVLKVEETQRAVSLLCSSIDQDHVAATLIHRCSAAAA